MSFIITRDQEFLKNIHCFCGKPAEVAWYLPSKKLGPQKLSKTDDGPRLEAKPYPYGRSCEAHIPLGLT